MLNKAMGHVTTLYMFKEDTRPFTLAEKKAANPGPALVNISIQPIVPGKAQLIGNLPCFY
jgi:hypothetical protein